MSVLMAQLYTTGKKIKITSLAYRYPWTIYSALKNAITSAQDQAEIFQIDLDF